MPNRSICFLLFGLILFVQTIQAQDVAPHESDTTIVVEKEKDREKEKLTRKLKKAKKKQSKILSKFTKTDSLHITSRQLKKLESGSREIKTLEKELTTPKINKNKLLSDLSKDENVAPYLKDYAKYKQVKNTKNAESAVKKANKEVLKNKELDEALKGTDKLKGTKLDSASIVAKGKALGQKELNEQEEVIELKKELKPFMNTPYLKGYTLQDLDSLNADSLKVIAKNTFNDLDKLLEKELSKREEMAAFQMEMSKMKELKKSFESSPNELDDTSENELKNQLTTAAHQYIVQNSDKLQKMQSQTKELKRKYSTVLNSNDLHTATKRSSLKGQPFWKRFFIGGNIDFKRLDSMIVDVAPLIGYRLDKKFEFGASLIYQAQWKKQNNWNSDKDKVYGYSAFANYAFYKSFICYVELEKINSGKEIDGKIIRSWREAFLIGIGRKFKVSQWLELQAIFAYNLLHDNSGKARESPFVFKTGVRLKK